MASPYTFVVVQSETSLREHVEAWDDLAVAAAEPNPFYESWSLLPAIALFGKGLDFSFVLVYGLGKKPGQAAELCGFFPFILRKQFRVIPSLHLWRHNYCYLTTPLLRIGHTEAVVERLFDWFVTQAGAVPIWAMETASREGPFGQALVQACFHRGRPVFVLDAYARALLVRWNSAEEYLQHTVSARHRKDLRRKERLLTDKGKLEKRVLQTGDDVSTWVEQFLQLEASGWKGVKKTAILCNAVDAEYFRVTSREAFARGQLMMLGLFLGGRPIALKYNIISGSGAFTCKIAMDEELAPCSPGLLLEVFNIEYLHQQTGIRWMDSCAPDHPMLTSLWAERLVVQTVLVATGHWLGDLVVSLLPLSRWLKRSLRWRRKQKLDVEEQQR